MVMLILLLWNLAVNQFEVIIFMDSKMHNFNNSEVQERKNRQSNDQKLSAPLIPREDLIGHSFSIHFHHSYQNDYEWAETPYQSSEPILYAHRNDPHSLCSYNSQQSRHMKKQEPPKKENQQQLKREQPPPQPILFSQEAIKRRRQAIKGRLGETKNLGTLFKRYTVNFLDLLLACNDLEGEDKRVALQFKQKGVKLQQFEKLFESKAIRKHAKAYFKSSLFMKSILRSQCEGINTKLLIFKYVSKFYELIQHKIKSWKLSQQ